MIRVFAGEDTYRSRMAYLAALQEARPRGPVTVLRDETLTVDRLAASLQGPTLFGTVPTVAVEEFTTFTGAEADTVVGLLNRLPSAVALLAWERGVLPERSKVVKAFHAHGAHIDTFTPLTFRERARWVDETVRARGGDIRRDAIDALVRACGSDLWTISAEVEKLCLFARGRTIEAADVATLTIAAIDADLFATVRALATGEGARALELLARHRAHGDDPRLVLSVAIREVRTLLLIRDRLDRGGRPTPWTIAREHHLPAAVADVLLRAARDSSATHLRSLFDRLVVSLYALNTGRAEPDDVLDSVAFQAIEKGGGK